jgi:hypothetical protein
MLRDEQNSPGTEARPTAAEQRARGAGFKAAACLVAAAALLAATGFFLVTRLSQPPQNTAPSEEEADDPRLGRPLFQGWTKPDLALVLSAQQHGYLLPCGCSRPQIGGLERRYNFLQTLKERGWPVVAVDLGDIPQRQGPRRLPNLQGLLKYEYSMRALREMGYTAVTVGEHELAMPLDRALGQYALNNPEPRVIVDNLANAEENFPGTGRWRLTQPLGSPLKVAVAGVVGPTVQERAQDPAVHFLDNRKVLADLLKEMDKQKPDLRVLLYQGLPREAYECARHFPQFNVILCLSEYEEPSGNPQKVGPTLIVSVGHKGKYVGVVGAWRTGRPDQPLDLRYQLVPMSERYLTPENKADSHPIVALMEQYTKELKRDGYLKKYGQTRHPVQVAHPQATYVGSEKCKKCHEYAYTVWKDSAHSHAYDTLVSARRPSLRQYDAECVVCHVIGFATQGGFTSAEATPHLKHVGCESCHGPASLHVADPNNEALRVALNPWKAQPGESEAKRLSRVEQNCVQCHDPDNDVHWDFKKWEKIAH